ncbi:MAG TPA: hypothetical protein VKZ59_06730 [Acidobacteriota bacterium]|nr:hypothetical protein [Acidobacteriota bacterium]
MITVERAEEDADVAIQPISEAGEGIVVPFHLELAGREKRTLFLSELFPEIFSGDTNGSISIRSKTRLAITVLRTRSGLPVTNSPIATTE